MSRPPRGEELRICGQNACRSLFRHRPDDVVRVYLTADLVRPFGDLLRACAQARRPYRVVGADELEKITESHHHEGICVVARPRAARPLAEILRHPGPGWLVALVGVENPHNVGAILRTAAHFGARGALLAGAAGRLSAAAHRTAEGGTEALDVTFTTDLAGALALCRAAGYRVCATSSHAGRDLYTGPLPARAVVLLGAEDDGLPAGLQTAADELWRIPGTGHVESLNVATAVGVLLGELWRQHRMPAPHTPRRGPKPGRDHSSS